MDDGITEYVHYGNNYRTASCVCMCNGSCSEIFRFTAVIVKFNNNTSYQMSLKEYQTSGHYSLEPSSVASNGGFAEVQVIIIIVHDM